MFCVVTRVVVVGPFVYVKVSVRIRVPSLWVRVDVVVVVLPFTVWLVTFVSDEFELWPLVVPAIRGGDSTSVLAETQESPLRWPMYGECLIPKA